MLEVDLSRLLGGKGFTTLYTLYCNRCKINTAALANIKANAFALFNTKCTKKISKFLNTLLETLKRLVPIRGYNRQARKPITLILQTYLQVNRQQLYNIPFLVTNLKHYNVILSCK